MLARCQPHAALLRPNLANSAVFYDVCPNVVPDAFEPARVEPNLGEIDQQSPELGNIWAEFAKNMADMGEKWPHVVEIGPPSVKVASKLAEIKPKLAGRRVDISQLLRDFSRPRWITTP